MFCGMKNGGYMSKKINISFHADCRFSQEVTVSIVLVKDVESL